MKTDVRAIPHLFSAEIAEAMRLAPEPTENPGERSSDLPASVCALYEDAPPAEASRLFLDGIRHILIVDRDERPLGLVSRAAYEVDEDVRRLACELAPKVLDEPPQATRQA